MPSISDLKDLRAIVSYVDLNINMCSTMSLDSIIFGKPVINVVLGHKQSDLFYDQKYLEYEHYKRVIESGAVTLAKTKTDFINAINESLNSSNLRLSQQTRLLDLQISKPLEGTSKRIVKTLHEWA
jgi:hypothetical protein